jgi:hypothetical protein
MRATIYAHHQIGESWLTNRSERMGLPYDAREFPRKSSAGKTVMK